MIGTSSMHTKETDEDEKNEKKKEGIRRKGGGDATGGERGVLERGEGRFEEDFCAVR